MSDKRNSGCPVCGDLMDGSFHYGVASCRGCAMFFKRCIEKNLKFDRHRAPAPGEKAVVVCDVKNNRNLCRQCRLQLCLDVGMQPSAVQKKRCSTGPQPNRKRKNALPMEEDEEAEEAEERDEAFLEMQEEQKRRSAEWQSYCPQCDGRCIEGIDFFTELIEVYGDHFRMMQLEFVNINTFLQGINSSVKLREFVPEDVKKLGDVERAGLLFWVERMGHYRELPEEDQTNLLNRYSVRKLSLDHFYSASKYPEMAKERKFVMNNYTYVPPDKTGFELANEDLNSRETKRRIFAGTFQRFWDNVIDRFIEWKFGDAEMVFLHLMLMWSPLNQRCVTNATQAVLRSRRTWTFKMMFEYYRSIDFPEPEIRIADLVAMFQEVEIVVDMHCADVHVAMLFNFFGLEDFWYKSTCYNSINLDRPLDGMDKKGLDNSLANLAYAMCNSPVNNPSAVVPRIKEFEKGFIAKGIAVAEIDHIPWYSEGKQRLSMDDEEARVPATRSNPHSSFDLSPL